MKRTHHISTNGRPCDGYMTGSRGGGVQCAWCGEHESTMKPWKGPLPKEPARRRRSPVAVLADVLSISDEASAKCIRELNRLGYKLVSRERAS